MASLSNNMVFLVALVTAALLATASGQGFLAKKGEVSSASVKAELTGVISEVLGQGHGVADARLTKIHKSLDPLFRALPKNKEGRISSPFMRYAVRRYFSQTHGWVVKGFNAWDEQGTPQSLV